MTNAVPKPDRPGRWVGGALGMLACLFAVIVGLAIGLLHLAGDASDSIAGLTVTVALLGMPIAFVLGRLLLPGARSDGARRAMVAGLEFGVIAPVLGALEIVSLGLLVPWDRSLSLGPDGFIWLPFAIPFSFVALPITVPVGLAWALMAIRVPEGTLVSLRAGPFLARLGVRHALIAILIWMVGASGVAAALRGG